MLILFTGEREEGGQGARNEGDTRGIAPHIGICGILRPLSFLALLPLRMSLEGKLDLFLTIILLPSFDYPKVSLQSKLLVSMR